MPRYGLLVKPYGRKKPVVKYVKASTAMAAKRKFYGSAYHFKTEAGVISARKVPKGYRLEVEKRKRRKRRR